jgi:GNAT superfamily N-acetyltransferase
MAPLDELFGEGTSAAFAERMNVSGSFPGVTATVLEWNAVDGSVGTETRWTTAKGALVGFYRLNYKPPTVHCVALQVEPAFQGKGLLTFLCSQLNQWWATLGLTRNTMYTKPGSNAERMLRLAGFAELPDGSWGCELPSTQLEEVVEYLTARKEGKSLSEPSWRQALPVPTEEVF